MTHEQVYCTFNFLKASAHTSTPSGLGTPVVPTSFELKVKKTVLKQFQNIKRRRRGNLTHKLTKSIQIAIILVRPCTEIWFLLHWFPFP